ncbi:glycosyl hydrolase [Aspergillus pseudodeflectus]|uniref:Glycosyl hydrolase n=1 Tax=Aspergillus pseudodeflectus TaxID=176178 RepID=A0ABR4L3U5_9EURO
MAILYSISCRRCNCGAGDPPFVRTFYETTTNQTRSLSSKMRVNPVIPGFAPDPSLVYVDGTYFLVNSSFHIFPGVPVYESNDLRRWKHIGNALNRPRQLSLRHSVTKIVVDPTVPEDKVQGGIYAPMIRYHKGTFYIVCTNILHKQSQAPDVSEYENFILSTTNIWADEWSDPIFYGFKGIDTSLFWDNDDRVYLVGAASSPNAKTKIRQFEIDLRTGAKLSEEKLLWEGVTKVYPEGPHMYKKDGWYYLLITEGGCFANHHTIISMSRDIWGPYEVNPANLVMKKADPSAYIQHTGQWYFVCLGVRKTNGRFIMGRESVLTTATWPEGGYPKTDPVQVDALLATKGGDLPVWPASRAADRPDVAFVHIRYPIGKHYKLEGSIITLTATKADVSQSDEPVTFIGKRQRRLTGSSSVVLGPLVPSKLKGSALKTGLCYYKDEHRFIRAFLDMVSGDVVLEIVNKAKSIGLKTARHFVVLDNNACIAFGIDYTETELVLWYAVDESCEVRKELGRVDTLDMTGLDFVGPIIGIYATSIARCKFGIPNSL